MTFEIDGGWSYAGMPPQTGLSYKILLIYLDKGTDKLSLQYPDGKGGTKTEEIQKQGTNKWVEKNWIITDAYFNDQLDGMADLRIWNNGDGDETIHMLDVAGSWSGFSPTPI